MPKKFSRPRPDSIHVLGWPLLLFKRTNSRTPFKHNTKSQLRVANQVRVTSAVRVRFQIIFSVFFFYVFILMAFSEISASSMMSVGNITNIELFLRALRV